MYTNYCQFRWHIFCYYEYKKKHCQGRSIVLYSQHICICYTKFIDASNVYSNITTPIVSVKEKVKDKTKKNSSSLKLVRRTTFMKMMIMKMKTTIMIKTSAAFELELINIDACGMFVAFM